MATKLLYPGSFNPVHSGHLEMAKISKEVTGLDPIFLVSRRNADKEKISDEELFNRCLNIRFYGYNAVGCDFPIFAEKVKTYGNDLIFIVGVDTWSRIWDEKYGPTKQQLMDLFKKQNIKFIVFPRGNIIPMPMEGIMIGDNRISSFKNELSSTQIRNNESK